LELDAPLRNLGKPARGFGGRESLGGARRPQPLWKKPGGEVESSETSVGLTSANGAGINAGFGGSMGILGNDEFL